uniref:Apple domain-containing protein n=1 Tax=Clytia hemisphaerica TaxID=252671 RepID=A0A7M5X1Y7_9CNID
MLKVKEMILVVVFLIFQVQTAIGCEVQYGLNYPRHNIDSKILGTWQECAIWCDTVPGCNFWTWVHNEAGGSNQLRCYLKSQGVISGINKNWRAVSGSKGCTNSVQHNRCTPHYGRFWYDCGSFVNFFPILTWQHCADVCSTLAECHHWQWKHDVKKCYTRTGGIANTCQLTQNPDFVSGIRNCQQAEFQHLKLF